MSELIYLDNNATTQPLPEVVKAMMPYLQSEYGNPSSVHQFGQRMRHAVETARRQVADLINASPREIVFTSGGTESINLAIRGLCGVAKDKRRIVTSHVEHSATRNLCQALTAEGYDIVEVRVDGGGQLDLDELHSALTDDTALVSILWANNETGVLFDVDAVAAICHERGVPLHIDAVQAVGKVRIDVEKTPITMMSMSAHKLHGPKGVGALFIRRRTRVAPLIVGGGQERNVRGGTENVPAIVGMGEAARRSRDTFDTSIQQMTKLRDRLEHGILEGCPGSVVHGNAAARIPNTTNIGFAGAQAEGILILLSQIGICASSGSACSSGALEPSYVLEAMGVDPSSAAGAIRFGVSHVTSVDDIDRVVQAMPTILARLKPPTVTQHR